MTVERTEEYLQRIKSFTFPKNLTDFIELSLEAMDDFVNGRISSEDAKRISEVGKLQIRRYKERVNAMKT